MSESDSGVPSPYEEIPEESSAPKDTPKKKRKGWKITVIILTSLLVLVIAIAAAIGIFANRAINSMQSFGNPFEGIDNRPSAAPVESGEESPVNVLIMGSDSRISAGDPNDWQFGAQRTDALMLIQISGDREHISVMSIPRDSWVDVPGYGMNKINAAFSYGGAPLTIQTVEQVTGVRIDHIAIVDFTAFTKLTDIVGGVTLETADGPQTMDGEEALEYVRERYSLPRGDFDRVRRQQAWMKAVLSQLLTKETLSSPGNIMDITDTMSKNVAIDEDLGINKIISIGTSLSDFNKNNLIFFTAPVTGTGTSDDGQSIVLLDEDKLASVSEAFQQDDVAAFMEENQSDFDTLTGRPVD